MRPHPFFEKNRQRDADMLAARKTSIQLGADFLIRSMDDQGQGMDAMVEDTATPGAANLLFLKIKGVTREIVRREGDDEVVSLRGFSRHTAICAEQLVRPLLVVYTCVNEDQSPVYYLWLQQYIEFHLNVREPDWRERRDALDLRIPIGNRIEGANPALRAIAMSGASDSHALRICRTSACMLSDEPGRPIRRKDRS